MNVLVIAAHPDDEVLGCGGTIARLASEGKNVHIVILAEGITSRADVAENEAAEQMKILHQQAKAVGKFLGATDVQLLGFPDNRMDTVPLLDVVQKIEKVIEEIQPDVVYTQHGGDLNIDHSVTFRATLTATRPMEGCPVKCVYAYEVGSSTEWSFQKLSPVFRPTSYVDISSTLDKKMQAMTIYTSEVRPFPHPRSPAAISTKAKFHGSTVGLHAAEAFELIRGLQ